MTDGTVNLGQAEVIVDALRDLSTDVSPAQRAEGERTLIGQCASLDPAGLGRLGRRLEELLDRDGVQARDEAKIRDHEAKAFGRREFTLSPDPYGSGGLIRGRYDAAGYAVLTAALDALSTRGRMATPRPVPDPTGTVRLRRTSAATPGSSPPSSTPTANRSTWAGNGGCVWPRCRTAGLTEGAEPSNVAVPDPSPPPLE